MKNNLFKKLTESLFSILPVSLIVIVLGLTPLVGFSLYEIIVFIECSLFLVIGMGFFNLGADMAMTPIGSHVGSGLTKSKTILANLEEKFTKVRNGKGVAFSMPVSEVVGITPFIEKKAETPTIQSPTPEKE